MFDFLISQKNLVAFRLNIRLKCSMIQKQINEVFEETIHFMFFASFDICSICLLLCLRCGQKIMKKYFPIKVLLLLLPKYIILFSVH